MPITPPRQDAKPSLRQRALYSLTSPRGVWLLVALSLVLCIRSLGNGLEADDHVASYNARVGSHPFSTFSATPAELARTHNTGGLAWWASPNLRLNLLRPVTSLTHYVDYQLWPNAAWAMHLSNCLLYAALVAVAWLLYREFLPGSVLAGLAALMFTIDEGHAPAIGWISSRNTLLSGLFAALALLAHVRARTQRSRGLHAASALCCALALLSGEGGVAAFAYLIAYACVFEAGTWARRLRSLAPQFGVFVVWAAGYVAMGCGIHNSSWYRNLSEPFALLREGLLDTPLWLVTLLGPSMVGAGVLVPPSTARLVALLVVVPLLAGLALGVPRTKQHGFFALGALLCLPPLFATWPQDRLVICASFGIFGLLAGFLDAARQSASRVMRGFRHAMAGLHLGVAPLLFIGMLSPSRNIELATDEMIAALPTPVPRQAIVVNTPVELLNMYALTLLFQRPEAAHLDSFHQLYSGSSPLLIERPDANTLQLTAALGWGRIAFERVFCSVHDMPRAGSEIDVSGMHVSVLESNEHGMPARVQFRFPNALESPDRAWYVWRGAAPEPWRPPAIGEQVALPAFDVFSWLTR